MKRPKETIQYKNYTITTHNLCPHGYTATAVRDGFNQMWGDPPDFYSTSKTSQKFKGVGAKQNAIKAVKEMVDAGPPPITVWTVINQDTRKPYGEIKSPSHGVARALMLREWGNVPGLHLEIQREPRTEPWDWNGGNIYRKISP